MTLELALIAGGTLTLGVVIVAFAWLYGTGRL